MRASVAAHYQDTLRIDLAGAQTLSRSKHCLIFFYDELLPGLQALIQLQPLDTVDIPTCVVVNAAEDEDTVTFEGARRMVVAASEQLR